jgi:hypothetical protein
MKNTKVGRLLVACHSYLNSYKNLLIGCKAIKGGSEVLTAVIVKSMSMIFWVVIPCNLAEVHLHFRGTYHPHKVLRYVGTLLPNYTVLNPEDRTLPVKGGQARG